MNGGPMSVPEGEAAAACAMLRSKEKINRDYLAVLIEAQQGEISRLRQVIRCADYFVTAGQDSRYDEARKALVNFDKENSCQPPKVK
jgi:hypothetical protein